MKRSIRLAVLALVAIGVLAFAAGSAFAAYTTPTLEAEIHVGQKTTIAVTQSRTDDATYRASIFAPMGTATTLGQAPGSSLGTVKAQVVALALGGALLPLTGTVQVRAASGTYLSGHDAGSDRSRRDAVHGHRDAHGVLGPDPPGRRPDARAAGLRRRRDRAARERVRVGVDPGLPAAAGRAGRNARSRDVRVQADEGRLQGERHLLEPRHGQEARWRVLATPYNPGQGTPNAAGTVEAQSVVRVPALGRRSRRPTLKLTKTVATLAIRGGVLAPAGAAGDAAALPRRDSRRRRTGSVTLKDVRCDVTPAR